MSNLNRQFLFRKSHVGRPKVEVAREAILQFNPQAKITAIHDSVFKSAKLCCAIFIMMFVYFVFYFSYVCVYFA